MQNTICHELVGQLTHEYSLKDLCMVFHSP